MKTFIEPGHAMLVTAGADIVSGQVVAVGKHVGIASHAIANGATGTIWMFGVFKVTKVGSQAWAQGDVVFWDGTNSRFTKTASADADIPAGIAFEVAGSGAGVTTGYVLLIPGYKGMSTAIADVATADGSDATTTQALANALKVKINALLAAMRVAGLLDT